MTMTIDEVELKEVEKDRAIIREAQNKVATSIAFNQLERIDIELYRRYNVLRRIIAGQKREASE